MEDSLQSLGGDIYFLTSANFQEPQESLSLWPLLGSPTSITPSSSLTLTLVPLIKPKQIIWDRLGLKPPSLQRPSRQLLQFGSHPSPQSSLGEGFVFSLWQTGEVARSFTEWEEVGSLQGTSLRCLSPLAKGNSPQLPCVFFLFKSKVCFQNKKMLFASFSLAITR